ncbi:flagellar hook-length control protein FliK [Rhodobacter sp. NTK016B]|uniref:flagellar hook-length control protein FliK n=1 Tax=Rhodobacter sp. NTK016B TaxID=2759676 RepID=UPI001A8DF1B0|nr:flagellar hook-length control protein FliK [Rhodobacter sp. NTK016B]MBN8292322.1 flagellar hook-length control protein FliK [Rhodobacter sp. NTK016B]
MRQVPSLDPVFTSISTPRLAPPAAPVTQETQSFRAVLAGLRGTASDIAPQQAATVDRAIRSDGQKAKDTRGGGIEAETSDAGNTGAADTGAGDDPYDIDLPELDTPPPDDDPTGPEGDAPGIPTSGELDPVDLSTLPDDIQPAGRDMPMPDTPEQAPDTTRIAMELQAGDADDAIDAPMPPADPVATRPVAAPGWSPDAEPLVVSDPSIEAPLTVAPERIPPAEPAMPLPVAQRRADTRVTTDASAGAALLRARFALQAAPMDNGMARAPFGGPETQPRPIDAPRHDGMIALTPGQAASAREGRAVPVAGRTPGVPGTPGIGGDDESPSHPSGPSPARLTGADEAVAAMPPADAEATSSTLVAPVAEPEVAATPMADAGSGKSLDPVSVPVVSVPVEGPAQAQPVVATPGAAPMPSIMPVPDTGIDVKPSVPSAISAAIPGVQAPSLQALASPGTESRAFTTAALATAMPGSAPVTPSADKPAGQPRLVPFSMPDTRPMTASPTTRDAPKATAPIAAPVDAPASTQVASATPASPSATVVAFSETPMMALPPASNALPARAQTLLQQPVAQGEIPLPGPLPAPPIAPARREASVTDRAPVQPPTQNSERPDTPDTPRAKADPTPIQTSSAPAAAPVAQTPTPVPAAQPEIPPVMAEQQTDTRADRIELSPRDEAPGDSRAAIPHASTQHSQTLPPSAQAQRIGQQIAAQIQQPALSGPGGFSLALDPEELGHVRLTLVNHEAASVLMVHADRPETLDLMRRHIALLEQDLRSMGHDALSLRFSGGEAGHPGGGGTGTSSDRATQPALQPQMPDSAAPPAQRSPAMTGPLDHLDLRL